MINYVSKLVIENNQLKAKEAEGNVSNKEIIENNIKTLDEIIKNDILKFDPNDDLSNAIEYVTEYDFENFKTSYFTYEENLKLCIEKLNTMIKNKSHGEEKSIQQQSYQDLESKNENENEINLDERKNIEPQKQEVPQSNNVHKKTEEKKQNSNPANKSSDKKLSISFPKDNESFKNILENTGFKLSKNAEDKLTFENTKLANREIELNLNTTENHSVLSSNPIEKEDRNLAIRLMVHTVSNSFSDKKNVELKLNAGSKEEYMLMISGLEDKGFKLDNLLAENDSHKKMFDEAKTEILNNPKGNIQIKQQNDPPHLMEKQQNNPNTQEIKQKKEF